MATKSTAPGLDHIDRLEDKIKTLVTVIGRLKGEQARAIEDNGRLQREVEALKARLADADRATTELASLKEERDVIRTRVSEMLDQLEGLSL
jgi:regulator of replication initiation timing